MRPLLAITALLLLGAGPSERLTEQQRALHALNRLGFGPRPADVERVLQIGVNQWIEQQLAPAKISDAAVDAKLQRYATLSIDWSGVAIFVSCSRSWRSAGELCWCCRI